MSDSVAYRVAGIIFTGLTVISAVLLFETGSNLWAVGVAGFAYVAGLAEGISGS